VDIHGPSASIRDPEDDLLKKTIKGVKQNGTEPTVKRLFQAIKLTESALRHVRRSQVMNKKSDIQGSA
jgi:hypothetical protein